LKTVFAKPSIVRSSLKRLSATPGGPADATGLLHPAF